MKETYENLNSSIFWESPPNLRLSIMRPYAYSEKNSAGHFLLFFRISEKLEQFKFYAFISKTKKCRKKTKEKGRKKKKWRSEGSSLNYGHDFNRN